MPHHSPSAKKSKSTLRILLFPHDGMSQRFLTMQHFILTFLYSILFSTSAADVLWLIISHTSLVLLLLTQCYLYSFHQTSSQYCHNFIWLSVLITQEFLMVKENVFKHNSVCSAHILLHKSTCLNTFNLWYYSLINSVTICKLSLPPVSSSVHTTLSYMLSAHKIYTRTNSTWQSVTRKARLF